MNRYRAFLAANQLSLLNDGAINSELYMRDYNEFVAIPVKRLAPEFYEFIREHKLKFASAYELAPQPEWRQPKDHLSTDAPSPVEHLVVGFYTINAAIAFKLRFG